MAVSLERVSSYESYMMIILLEAKKKTEIGYNL